MTPGPSVRCIPLDEDRWLEAALELLAMTPTELESCSADTHAECLLSPSHLVAQRKLFP